MPTPGGLSGMTTVQGTRPFSRCGRVDWASRSPGRSDPVRRSPSGPARPARHVLAFDASACPRAHPRPREPHEPPSSRHPPRRGRPRAARRLLDARTRRDRLAGERRPVRELRRPGHLHEAARARRHDQVDLDRDAARARARRPDRGHGVPGRPGSRASGPPMPRGCRRSRTSCRARRPCSTSSPTWSTRAGSRRSPPTPRASATSSPGSASPPTCSRPRAAAPRCPASSTSPRSSARSARWRRSSASTPAPLIAEQQAALDAIVPDERGLTALWYSSGTDTPYVGAGIGAPELVLETVGLTNIAGDIDQTWSTLGWESIVEADPDVIVLIDADWNTAQSKIDLLESNPATARLSAVQNDRVPHPAVRLERGRGAHGLGGGVARRSAHGSEVGSAVDRSREAVRHPWYRRRPRRRAARVDRGRRDDRRGRPRRRRRHRLGALAPRDRHQPARHPPRRHRVGAAAPPHPDRRRRGRRARARRRRDAGHHAQSAGRSVSAGAVIRSLARGGERAAARGRAAAAGRRVRRSPRGARADARARERARAHHPDPHGARRRRRLVARRRDHELHHLLDRDRRLVPPDPGVAARVAERRALGGRRDRGRRAARGRAFRWRSAAASWTPSRSATRPPPRSGCPCRARAGRCSPRRRC